MLATLETFKLVGNNLRFYSQIFKVALLFENKFSSHVFIENKFPQVKETSRDLAFWCEHVFAHLLTVVNINDFSG